MDQKIYFDILKEKGNGFFVQYHPPTTGFLFASLTITYLAEVNIIDVIKELEKQNKKWTERYPITVMSNAFDKRGNLIDLSPIKPTNYLTSLIHENTIENHWTIIENNAFPSNVLDSTFLLNIYSDINYKTQSEINFTVYQKEKSIKHFKTLLIIWAVVIPVFISLLEFFSPTWVAVIALLFSFWKAYQQWLQITGRIKKSETDIAEENKEIAMRHHQYHCELNPEGFLRLKNENFNTAEEGRIKYEYDSSSNSK